MHKQHALLTGDCIPDHCGVLEGVGQRPSGESFKPLAGVCTMTKNHFSYVQPRSSPFSSHFWSSLFASLTARMLSLFAAVVIFGHREVPAVYDSRGGQTSSRRRSVEKSLMD
jgi:hypothetical protein